MARNSNLILASASPRRHELLQNAGIAHTVRGANIVEETRPGEAARDFAERLAREKAVAVAAQYPDKFILGADTVVVVTGEILGKPRDAEDAVRMLRLLSGRVHQVTTGVCLQGPGVQDVRSETTSVTMSELGEDEIRAYVATGEPMDKAGSYAIQGWASRWIPRIEGDYFNVVGLPLALVTRMLKERGI